MEVNPAVNAAREVKIANTRLQRVSPAFLSIIDCKGYDRITRIGDLRAYEKKIM